MYGKQLHHITNSFKTIDFRNVNHIQQYTFYIFLFEKSKRNMVSCFTTFITL